jgi:hypothetical protein
MPVIAVVAVVLAIIGGLAVFGVIGLKIYEWIPSPSNNGGGSSSNPLDPGGIVGNVGKGIGGTMILLGAAAIAIMLIVRD